MENSGTAKHSLHELIGRDFYTVCHLRPIGYIETDDRRWVEALSENGYVPRRKLVRVLALDAPENRVIVRQYNRHD